MATLIPLSGGRVLTAWLHDPMLAAELDYLDRSILRTVP